MCKVSFVWRKDVHDDSSKCGVFLRFIERVPVCRPFPVSGLDPEKIGDSHDVISGRCLFVSKFVKCQTVTEICDGKFLWASS